MKIALMKSRLEKGKARASTVGVVAAVFARAQWSETTVQSSSFVKAEFPELVNNKSTANHEQL